MAGRQIDGFAQLKVAAIDNAADPLVYIACLQPVVDVKTDAMDNCERYGRANRKTKILATLFAGAIERVAHAADKFGH